MRLLVVTHQIRAMIASSMVIMPVSMMPMAVRSAMRNQGLNVAAERAASPPAPQLSA